MVAIIGCTALRLVDRVLFVSDSDPTLVIGQIIHASINIIVDHLTRLEEGLLHIECSLGTCLQENQSVLLGKSLAFFGANLSSGVQVCFVSNKHDHYVRVAILSDFLQPSCQVVECLLAGDVIHKQGPCCTSVVAPSDGLERLLACSVPNLQLDVLVVNLDGPGTKLYANGEVVLLPKPLVRELQKKAGLADT